MHQVSNLQTMDIIGKIHPPASNQHAWILVVTDYFTKWVEARSYRSISRARVVKFFESHIVHRFGIPKTIMVDNDLVFTSAGTQDCQENGNQACPFDPLLSPV